MLECQEGRRKTQFASLLSSHPTKEVERASVCRVRGADPAPAAGGYAAPGRGAHLLARTSACSPRARAASWGIASQLGNDQL